ncbi:polyprenyl synthetase family protein [Streptococcus marimammalium]|uniref:polyprenyl synthetase family protein n=1 Tax=Streptococcus marimammalium TaxID=269666 RepID=UPI00037FAF54|nr:polyprenyl synthetase family protein [Streptococcus marimammalium]
MIHTLWENYPDINDALEEVKEIMLSNISVIHPKVKQKITQYINAPGKYVRAGLLVMLAKATDGEIKTGKLYLAASIEAFHLATLIHDDVIDQADTRRNIETFHQTFSNKIAIYTGDYLLSYSSKLAALGLEELIGDQREIDYSKKNFKIVERILSGELSQLMNSFNTNITVKDYLKQVRGKTAFLFGIAAQMGVLTANSKTKELNLAFNFGQSVGMAFQLTDDLIDFKKTEKYSGKPRLQDVRNGIYTFPVIVAKSQNPTIQDYLLDKKNQEWQPEELKEFYDLLERSKAFLETEKLINRYIDKSYKCLTCFLSKSDCLEIIMLLNTLFNFSD